MQAISGSVRSPGWPELIVAIVTYMMLVLSLSLLWLLRIPDEQAALRGIAGMAMNGVIGTVTLLIVVMMRIRNFQAFGFRGVTIRWLLIGLVVGGVAFFLSLAIEHVYFSFIIEVNNQADFQAAAKAGYLSLAILIFCGALLTPFGEEVVFRGIITNALNRYGAWVGVLGSALIFAAAHGPSVIFFNALMVGILTGILFRKTHSIWPGLVTHVSYNATWLVAYSLQ